MEHFKEVKPEKVPKRSTDGGGLTEHSDELTAASYVHEGISMNSTPCDCREEPEQLSVFYIY